MSEQKRIVEKLDKAFFEIEKSIEIIKKKEIALNSLKSSLLESELKNEDC